MDKFTKNLEKLKIVLILVLVLYPFSSFAQIRAGDIVLSISPENPKENEQITATLTSYATNLNISYISWLTNDSLITEGVGKRTFVFNAGELNTDITLTARINTTAGDSIIKNITITPTEIDLLWEATDSYVPPFYKGKTLVASEGSYKVVAIPNVYSLGQKLNSKNLSYTWKRDGSVAQSYSGWGKDYFIFKNTYLEKENKIEVSAIDILGKVKPVGETVLTTYNPKIVFYKKDPEFGIDLKNGILNTYELGEGSTTLVATPYFFSPKNIKTNDLKFEWSIDDEKISTPENKNEINLRGEEGENGTSVIKLLINNTKTLFQELETSINVNF